MSSKPHTFVALDDCETFTPASSAFLVLIDATHPDRNSDDTETVDGVLDCNEGKDLKRIIYRSPPFAAEVVARRAAPEASPIPGTRVLELQTVLDFYFQHHAH